MVIFEKNLFFFLHNCQTVFILYRNAVDAGNRGRKNFFPVEESPDCIEQGAPLKRGVPQTIFCGKTSATESRPPSQDGKGERVG